MELQSISDFDLIGQDLNFFDEVNLWFHFIEEDLLVCFNYIEEEYIYVALRGLCMKYGSGKRLKGHENGEARYFFKIPSQFTFECYEALKKLSS